MGVELGSSAEAAVVVELCGTVPSLASILASAAAMPECMMPSSANFRAKRAISASYASHSGIFRALASLGSFCKMNTRLQPDLENERCGTYGKRVLTQIDCLRSVKSILAA